MTQDSAISLQFDLFWGMKNRPMKFNKFYKLALLSKHQCVKRENIFFAIARKSAAKG
tara:strand:+ start:1696 stop:1866 length:171 start_codon:yes stop_codon:yes gene_type:complete